MKTLLWSLTILLIIGITIVILFSKIKRGINAQFIASQEYARQYPSQRTFPDSMKIDESIFWEIIEKAEKKSNGYIERQIELIKTDLVTKSNEFILKFECSFREILMESYHFNAMAAQKLIDGYVSDDTFLYFRCAVMLQGKDAYYTLIRSTDDYGNYLANDYCGEGLLFVTDEAYQEKNKNYNEDDLPSMKANYIDYDFGRHVVLGEYWETKKVIKERFPNLYLAIKRRSL